MNKLKNEKLLRLLHEELKEYLNKVEILKEGIRYFSTGGEIWKDMPGYEGLYQVSNHVQIRNIKWTTRRPLIQYNNRGNYAYKVVRLSKNGIIKTKLVHRMVALAFIPNPDNKETVNHKDLDKFNNNSHNLEWCTQKENIHHAIKNGAYIGRKKKS